MFSVGFSQRSSKLEEMEGEESGQSIYLPIPSVQVPMEACVPPQRPQLQSQSSLNPSFLVPSGFRVLMFTSPQYCSIHYYFSYSLSAPCVKFLKPFLNHSGENAILFLLRPSLTQRTRPFMPYPSWSLPLYPLYDPTSLHYSCALAYFSPQSFPITGASARITLVLHTHFLQKAFLDTPKFSQSPSSGSSGPLFFPHHSWYHIVLKLSTYLSFFPTRLWTPWR